MSEPQDLLSDEGLKYLTGLAELANLDVGSTRVTAKGLEHIAKLGKLRHLILRGNGISDDSLAVLSGLKHLAVLDLRDTPITDNGLKHLEGVPTLSIVCLSGTRVSDARIESLHRALPKCSILKDVGTGTELVLAAQGSRPKPDTPFRDLTAQS